MCGPSNPLQQFKQQTQLDRTLQQDRLTSRHSPAQGFRSANPNAGHLDPEFEAFQAGVPPSDLQHFQPFQQPPPNYGGPAQAPSWAADFQQMHISSPPPFQQHRMPGQGPSGSNWAQGFRDHIAQTTPRAQTSASSPQQFQQMARFGGMNGFQSSFAQQNMNPSFQSKGKEPVTEQFDEAAFERAFDQARYDMMGEEEMEDVSTSVAQDDVQFEITDDMRVDYQEELMRLEKQNKARLLAAGQEADRMEDRQNGQDTMMESGLESRQENAALRDYYQEQLKMLDESEELDEIDNLEALQDPHQIREGAINEQAESQERAKEDDDALAATAQELLEKVQHNQTDKFRNSQFLGLMRKLRDREAKVEGDQMVETNNVRSTHLQIPSVAPTSHPVLVSASRMSTSASVFEGFHMPRTPPEFDTHFELGWTDVEHDLDHWESPYR